MSKLALQLIAEAKRTKAKTLDLGKCSLTELPDELFELVWLEELYVCSMYWDYEKRKWIESKNKGGENRLSSIPKAISNLQSLQKLNLGYNEINDILVLSSLSSLTTLNLNSNKINDISFLEGLSSLTTLNLNSNKINDISFLEGLSNLTTLNLSSNKIIDYSFLEGLSNLTILDLHYNKIIDYSFLEGLSNLTTLNLSRNEINDISFLEGLSSLTTLNLSSNKINDISFLEGLSSLTGLYLSYNEINDISFLEGLSSLTDLDLSYNKINDMSFLTGLSNLTALYLSGNKINDISFLEGLSNLTTLNLSSNKIIDYSFLEGLSNLTTLNLSSNKIIDYSFLEGLSNLTALYLSGNKINDISFLEGLSNLTTLNLSSNKIIDYSFLEGLSNLTGLYLSDNEINDISFLEGLSNLTDLDLSYNKINDISFLEGLSSLTDLDLSYNKINDMSFLTGLSNLTGLYLSYNEINDIPFLGGLSNLTTLELSSNKISNISFLSSLENLTTLYLSYNQISDIRPLKKLIEKGIRLPLFGNPLEIPPKEIVGQGNQAILDYFKQLEKSEIKQFLEAKVLVIGAGGAGKTTFARKMQNPSCPMPEPAESTKDITIDRWTFSIAEQHLQTWQLPEKSKFYVNLWDFGGQKLYHAAHQFFFSSKCLYVLLADTREQKTDFEYWLHTIQQLGGQESSVFILLNKKAQHDWDIGLNQYQKRFGHLIKAYITVDLAEEASIPNLQAAIKKQLYALPDIHKSLIASWIKVRKALTAIEEPYISFKEFRQICRENDITGKASLQNISQYFHQVGVITHFIHDKVLKDRVYLNSNWLVKTVYQVLNAQAVKDKKGRLTKKEMESIWQGQAVDFEADKLSALLEKFGLLYQIGKSNQFIVPMHLSGEALYSTWPDEEKNKLHFRYEFNTYLPKGLMARLIVALHDKIDDHDLVWKYGFVVTHNGAKAEIVETKDGHTTFGIRIVGNFKRDLLTLITDAFDKILQGFPKLMVEKSVQCPCEECQTSRRPHFYKSKKIESRLAKRIAKKKSLQIECPASDEEVSITTILGLINYVPIFDNLKEKYIGNQTILLEIKKTQDLIEVNDKQTQELVKENDYKANVRQRVIMHKIDTLSDDIQQLEEHIIKELKPDYEEIKRYLNFIENDTRKINEALVLVDSYLKELPKQAAQEVKTLLDEAKNAIDPVHKLKLKYSFLFIEYECEWEHQMEICKRFVNKIKAKFSRQ